MSDLGGWKVLIVESREGELEDLTDMLTLCGVETNVVAYHQGAMLPGIMPTLALVDLRLPLDNCFDLLEKLRKAANTPVVAVTEHYLPRVASEAIRAGFDACLARPGDPSSFIRELERIVSVSSSFNPIASD